MKRYALLFVMSWMFALPLAVSQTVASAPTSPSTIAVSAPTAVPPLVPYVGAAVNAQGQPLANPASITFLIFKDETGGEPLFTESQSVIIDATGHYKVNLGATLSAGLPHDLFSTGDARWLEVQIAGQDPQPRVLLASVPYAMKAADAATLGGLPASAFVLVSQSPKGAAIVPDINTTVTTPGGSTGYVPEFSGTSTIVDSPIFINGSNVGIGTATPTAPLTVAGNAAVTGTLTATGNTLLNGGLAISGNSFYNGPVNVLATGTATATNGFNSQPFKFLSSGYDSTSQAAVSSRFVWQSEVTGNNTAAPSATLNLLSSKSTALPTETGFHFNANGTMNFASGQTFPGTGAGTVTGVIAGTALTGGGTTGTVTLNVDTTKVPLLASANHFTVSQSVTGNVSATGQLVSTVSTGTAPLAVSSTTQVPNLNASLLGGLAPSAIAALAVSNNFTAEQSFSKIGVGTATPRSLLELSATAKSGLGPVLTLTNAAGFANAESALDFNTNQPSTTGIYNPMVRIAAVDQLQYSDALLFQLNTAGSPNNGLTTAMTILPNGDYGLGGQVVIPSGTSANAQLTVYGGLAPPPMYSSQITTESMLLVRAVRGTSANTMVPVSASTLLEVPAVLRAACLPAAVGVVKKCILETALTLIQEYLSTRVPPAMPDTSKVTCMLPGRSRRAPRISRSTIHSIPPTNTSSTRPLNPPR